MSSPFTNVIQEYEKLWPQIEKLLGALESTKLTGEVVIPSRKCGDAYVTYDAEQPYLIIERGDLK